MEPTLSETPYTAHVDTFARDNLPPARLQPEYIFERPEFQFPARLNCATELLDRWVRDGQGSRVCLRANSGPVWTYAGLLAHANRIAHVLVNDMGLVPGNRVLLRAPNNPMMVACWFGVIMAGGIAVATMPLLRAKELGQVIEKGEITHALCDKALLAELAMAMEKFPTVRQIRCFRDDTPKGLEASMQRHPVEFDNVDTAADDTCILAFTSGTTGQPKGTMHFHRDVMAACACWPQHILKATQDGDKS